MNKETVFTLNGGGSNMVVVDEQIEFLRNFKGNCFSTVVYLPVKVTVLELANIITAAFVEIVGCEPTIKMYETRFTYFFTNDLYIAMDDGSVRDLWEDRHRTISFYLTGAATVLDKIKEYLKKASAPLEPVPSLTWEFLMDGERRQHHMVMEPAKPIFNELYPWIGDINTYFDDFMASEESVMILLGETGTGKTSFIRNLIWKKMLNTTFTYEESLMNSDAMFVSFIADNNAHLLVVEDADLLLTSRESHGNKTMAKFLNVTDGLANGLGKKKVIFTANILEEGKIDEALLRVGRCFDSQVFRRLTPEEANAAIKVAKLDLPPAERACTLAKLFAMTKKTQRHRVARMGFSLNETPKK